MDSHNIIRRYNHSDLAGLIIINKLLRRQIKHYMEEHRKRYFEFLKTSKNLPPRNTENNDTENASMTLEPK